LTGTTVNGSRNGARSGAQILCLLAAPLNVLILRALRDGPKQQATLRVEAGSPAQSTLRTQMKRLAEIGVVEKRRRNRFPGVLEHELTAPGQDLLFVLDVLERWLEGGPEGSFPLGSGAAKAVVKALAEAWSSTMLRALAAKRLSLTELDSVIDSLSYPSLERRLAALRIAGLVETCPGNGNGTPYRVTEWLRQGVGPLAAAARWERRHLQSRTRPIGRLEAETAFLLAVPLLRPPELRGSCRLAAEVPNGRKRHLAGVVVDIQANGAIDCVTKLDLYSDAWAIGSSGAWLDAVIEQDLDRLELGGDFRLASTLVEGLHDVLFQRRYDHRP
jgi:DNA-binding HxlR family transcriptional regulator